MKGIKEIGFMKNGGARKIVIRSVPWVAAVIVGAQFYAVRELFIVWTLFALAYCILVIRLLWLVISEPIRMALGGLPRIRLSSESVLHHSVDRASTARIQE